MPIFDITLRTPLHGRLHVVAARLAGRDTLEQALGDHVVDGVEGEVRVDRRRAVADEQRHVVHLAGIARLDHQAAPWSASSRAPGGGARPR